MADDDEADDDRSGDSPERKPPRGLASRDVQAAAARRYSVYVGIVFVALAIFAFVSTRLTGEDDTAVLDSSPADRGAPLALFSVPEALSPLLGDANVFQDDCETSRNPCPAEDVRTPACEVEGEDVVRVCDLFDRPLVISFWFTRGGDCLPSQDAFDDAAQRYGDEVNFLSVNVLDDREEVRRIVEERGWQVPVGYDADGAVASLYRVGGCPTLAFAYPGGILAGGGAGEADLQPEALDEKIDSLIVESRRRAEEGR